MYKNIVIPIDINDTESVSSVLSVATNLAKVYGSTIHFVYIIPDFGMKLVEDYLPKHWFRDQTDKYELQMKHLVSAYVPKNMETQFYVGRGTIYDQVINHSNNIKADLIIISAVGQRLSDYMLGSNASKIVRHASVSVLVVRD